MRTFYILLTFAFVAVSCSNSGTPDDTDYDRTALLENLSDNVLLPSYDDALLASGELLTASDNFIAAANATTLSALREAFVAMYLAWQDINMFEFGPADNAALRSNLNTYPLNTTNVANFITTGVFDLDALSSLDSKGLPALDYILYGAAANDAELLTFFTTDPKSDNYKLYLDAVVNDIRDHLTNVVETWRSSYASTFKASTGNSIGSSISLLLNAYIFHYERPFRTLKLGLPAGVFSLEGDIFPEEAEAFYSGISTALIKRNYDQIDRIFRGRDAQGIDRIGIDDYLEAVGATALSDEIKAQLNVIGQALQLLDETLTDQLASDRDTVLQVYAEIQRLVAVLKADLTSALSIQITYTDNDGD